MLAWALLVHLKSSRADPYQTSRLDSERHPVLSGQLEAHMEDTMSPRVLCHVVGPTLHQWVQAVGAAAILRMQLQKEHLLSLQG